MELSLISDTVAVAATQGLGFAKSVVHRHHFTSSNNHLSLSDSSPEKPSSAGSLQISAVILDAVAPPTVKPNHLRTARRTLLRKKRRTRRRTGGGPEEGDDGDFFGGGDDGGDGGGGFGGGGGWNFDRFGWSNWDDSSSSSPSDPAFDFVFEVISWIALSNCLHFAFKKVVRIVADGMGDPAREKVPIFTKEEKRGKERMVCNYKRLNDNTHKDQYSLPGINTIMAKIGHSKIYSKFDLKSGFHQVAMHPDSIECTAFWTPLGLYEWLVMPFGLKNAPAVFQRKMDVCFKGTEEFIAVYIDDILVFSPDEQTHEKHILVMIEICRKNGLILSPTKMKIAAIQIDFLGSTIGHGEIKLQAHIITKVANFSEETLKETKGLRSWLGLLNYARSYIKDLGRMEIKKRIQTLPNLSIPPEGCVIILETDGCMEGWGGICKWKKALKDPHSTERI
ncbi:unnamed protein product [Camellia sinensis]